MLKKLQILSFLMMSFVVCAQERGDGFTTPPRRNNQPAALSVQAARQLAQLAQLAQLDAQDDRNQQINRAQDRLHVPTILFPEVNNQWLTDDQLRDLINRVNMNQGDGRQG